MMRWRRYVWAGCSVCVVAGAVLAAAGAWWLTGAWLAIAGWLGLVGVAGEVWRLVARRRWDRETGEALALVEEPR